MILEEVQGLRMRKSNAYTFDHFERSGMELADFSLCQEIKAELGIRDATDTGRHISSKKNTLYKMHREIA